MSRDRRREHQLDPAARLAAVREAEEEADRLRRRFEQPDPAHEKEWLEQSSLVHGALIGVGVLTMQPFLTAPSLDLTATISVVAFSIAIPLLGGLILVNRAGDLPRSSDSIRPDHHGQVVAQTAAFIGVAAAFWHIHWVAGVGILVSGFLGLAIHSAGYVRAAGTGWGHVTWDWRFRVRPTSMTGIRTTARSRRCPT